MKIKALISQYGFSHGLITAAVSYAAYLLIPFYFATGMAAIGSAVYWLHREAKTRGSYDMSQWRLPDGSRYWDSIFDALTPMAVAVAVILVVYSTY